MEAARKTLSPGFDFVFRQRQKVNSISVGIKKLNLIAWLLDIVNINDDPSVGGSNRFWHVTLSERMIGDGTSVVLQPDLLILREFCVLRHSVNASMHLFSENRQRLGLREVRPVANPNAREDGG